MIRHRDRAAALLIVVVYVVMFVAAKRTWDGELSTLKGVAVLSPVAHSKDVVVPYRSVDKQFSTALLAKERPI